MTGVIHWTCLILLLAFSPLSCQSVRQMCEQLSPGDAFAYRSASQVAIIQVLCVKPLKLSQCQMDATAFFSLQPWTKWLENPTLLQKGQVDETFFNYLLDLELHPVSHPSAWRPKLEILKPVQKAVKWQLLQARLGKDLDPNLAGKRIVLYLAYGDELKKMGLPSHWPYWIENHEKLHKWVVYLVGADCKPNETQK